LDVLHDHHRSSSDLHEALDPDDVRMIDAREEPSLVSGSIQDLVIGRVGALENLQSDLSTERIGRDPRYTDRPKRPLAQDLEDFKWPRSPLHPRSLEPEL
jgi:hypothetical protein